MRLRQTVPLLLASVVDRLRARRWLGGWTVYIRRRSRMRESPPRPGWTPLPAGVHQALIDVSASPLRAVIPVASSIDAEGMGVDCLAVEIRDLGICVSMATRWQAEETAVHAFTIGPVHAFRRGQTHPYPEPVLEVTDDLGTSYRWVVGGGGSPGFCRWEVRVVPAPPPAARELHLVLRRFIWRDLFDAGAIVSTREGPWTFSVALPA